MKWDRQKFWLLFTERFFYFICCNENSFQPRKIPSFFFFFFFPNSFPSLHMYQQPQQPSFLITLKLYPFTRHLIPTVVKSWARAKKRGGKREMQKKKVSHLFFKLFFFLFFFFLPWETKQEPLFCRSMPLEFVLISSSDIIPPTLHYLPTLLTCLLTYTLHCLLTLHYLTLPIYEANQRQL